MSESKTRVAVVGAGSRNTDAVVAALNAAREGDIEVVHLEEQAGLIGDAVTVAVIDELGEDWTTEGLPDMTFEDQMQILGVPVIPGSQEEMALKQALSKGKLTGEELSPDSRLRYRSINRAERRAMQAKMRKRK